MWRCRCDCGNERVVAGAGLRAGRSKSCGCNAGAVTAARNRKHGFAARDHQAPEYKIWKAMKTRCYNENAEQYPDYGGRGIRICAEWLASFDRFLSDVGPRPSPDHSIDRYPNNDGNYEPGNVRWATRIQQSWNSRRVRVLSHNGDTLPIAEWSRRTGIEEGVIRGRLANSWSVDRALTTPARAVSPIWRQGALSRAAARRGTSPQRSE